VADAGRCAGRGGDRGAAVLAVLPVAAAGVVGAVLAGWTALVCRGRRRVVGLLLAVVAAPARWRCSGYRRSPARASAAADGGVERSCPGRARPGGSRPAPAADGAGPPRCAL